MPFSVCVRLLVWCSLYLHAWVCISLYGSSVLIPLCGCKSPCMGAVLLAFVHMSSTNLSLLPHIPRPNTASIAQSPSCTQHNPVPARARTHEAHVHAHACMLKTLTARTYMHTQQAHSTHEHAQKYLVPSLTRLGMYTCTCTNANGPGALNCKHTHTHTHTPLQGSTSTAADALPGHLPPAAPAACGGGVRAPLMVCSPCAAGSSKSGSSRAGTTSRPATAATAAAAG